jgi:integrase
MGTRAANNRSSVFQRTDGRWYGFVAMGTKPDGSADRRKRSGRAQAEVARKGPRRGDAPAVVGGHRS